MCKYYEIILFDISQNFPEKHYVCKSSSENAENHTVV